MFHTVTCTVPLAKKGLSYLSEIFSSKTVREHAEQVVLQTSPSRPLKHRWDWQDPAEDFMQALRLVGQKGIFDTTSSSELRFAKLQRVYANDYGASLLLTTIVRLAPTLTQVIVDASKAASQIINLGSHVSHPVVSMDTGLACIRLAGITIKQINPAWDITSVPLFAHPRGIAAQSVTFVAADYHRGWDSHHAQEHALKHIMYTWDGIESVDIRVERHSPISDAYMLSTNLKNWREDASRVLSLSDCPIKEIKMDSLIPHPEIKALQAKAAAEGRVVLYGEVIEEIIIVAENLVEQ